MNPIFVFGSNLAGRHGKGAALWALHNRGAIYGQGEGRQGMSYALPTKDKQIKTLPLQAIRHSINTFIAYAERHDKLTFEITQVGSGLAGYDWNRDIKPMFPNPLPVNCKFIVLGEVQ